MATTVGRATATYASDDDKYSLANKMHGQYFQLYYDRLMTLAPRVDEARRDAWGVAGVVALVTGNRAAPGRV